MSKFVLRRCHVRDGILAPTKDQEALTVDWPKLTEMLAPSKTREALMTLKSLRVGAFVGLTKKKQGSISNFMLLNQDRSATLEWVLKRDPEFEAKLLEAYRVDEIVWDSSIVEAGNSKTKG